MDAVHEPGVQEVVFKKSAQIGGTQLLLNIAGYFIQFEPSPILWVQTTAQEAEGFSKNRFGPFLRDNPAIGTLIDPLKSTIEEKYFPGGVLRFKGAKSAPGLRQIPIRVVIMDDLDGFPKATSEGDPVELAEARTKTFRYNKVIVKCSTPTTAETSRICREYERSDQRKFWVPCPECGEEQTLSWEQVQWEQDAEGFDDPRSAVLVCAHCGSGWKDAQRWRAVRRGRWRASRPCLGVAGFSISELYSPFTRLQDLVAKYLQVRDDEDELEVFINTVLGEEVSRAVERPQAEELFARREPYRRGTVPRRAVLLTAGVDWQKDRFECEVVGWGPRLESWSIDYAVGYGGPYEDGCWEALAELLNRDWPIEGGGTARIARMAIDSGSFTGCVYDWRRRQRDPRVMVCKGRDSAEGAIVSSRLIDYTWQGKLYRNGVRLFTVGASFLKDDLYGKLALPVPGPGFCHFPEGYDLRWFQQLVSEEQVLEKKGRTQKLVWTQHGPNEALDCRNLARAAASSLGAEHWQGKWQELLRQREPERPQKPPMRDLEPLETEREPEREVPSQARREVGPRRRGRRRIVLGPRNT